MKLYKFILLMLICPFTFAGTVDGGGAGFGFLNDFSRSAWFVNFNNPNYPHLEEISYCIEIKNESSKFSKSDIDIAFQNSVKRWKNYFVEKEFNKVKYFFGIQIQYITKFRREKCSDSTRLRILVSNTEDFTNEFEELKVYFHDLLTFDAYAKKIKDRKGVLWLSNNSFERSIYDWNLENLELIISHELGHIFGFKHISNTIMDFAITSILINKETLNNLELYESFLEIKDSVLKDLEWGNHLVDYSKFEHLNRLKTHKAYFGNDDLKLNKELFQKLFDINVKEEEILSTLSIAENFKHKDGQNLKLSNSEVSIVLNLNIDFENSITGYYSDLLSVEFQLPILGGVLEEDKKNYLLGIDAPKIFTYFGEAIWKNKSIPIILVVNGHLKNMKSIFADQMISKNPIQLFTIVNGKRFPLFNDTFLFKMGNLEKMYE